MTDHHNKIQSKCRPLKGVLDHTIISRDELAQARKAINNYRLRDELSYFKKRNKKKY